MEPMEPTKEAARREISRDVADWLRAGNRVEKVPTGVSGDVYAMMGDGKAPRGVALRRVMARRQAAMAKDLGKL